MFSTETVSKLGIEPKCKLISDKILIKLNYGSTFTMNDLIEVATDKIRDLNC